MFLLLALACRPGETPRAAPAPGGTPVAATPGRVAPSVRVGLVVDTAAVVVTAPTDFEVSAAAPDGGEHSVAGTPWTVTLTAGGLQARRADGRIVSGAGPLLVRPLQGDRVEIGGRAYRGEALLRAGRDGITVVNVLDLEAYLMGVVPREIGRRPAQEIEAVKAQAIAARTYAVGNMGGREALGFDFFASVMDQAYGGVPDEDSIATRAIRETRGEIVTYDGTPILAYYSSTCGGQTAAIDEAWPWRAPLPYLRSVSDRIPGTDDYYCATSNRFHWATTWTRAQLLSTLGATLREYTRTTGVQPGRVQNLEVLSRSASGRATLRLETNGNTYTLRADSLRWVLRTPIGGLLNSARIANIALHRAADGAVDSLTIAGGGWGHGIGMCQVGALGRARAGQRYDQILRTYYPGTELERRY